MERKRIVERRKEVGKRCREDEQDRNRPAGRRVRFFSLLSALEVPRDRENTLIQSPIPCQSLKQRRTHIERSIITRRTFIGLLSGHGLSVGGVGDDELLTTVVTAVVL